MSKKKGTGPYRGPKAPSKGWGYIGPEKYKKKGCFGLFIILCLVPAGLLVKAAGLL